MIESTFFSSCSWDSDLFQDFSTEISSATDFQDCIGNFESSSNVNSCCAVPNDLSCSSSDYESLVFGEFETISPVTDSFISQILEESNSISFCASGTLSLFNESKESDLSIGNSFAFDDESSPKITKSLRYLSTKPWSKMSSKEQMETLHILSDIVTCHMGIREQIEVIKIIDPSATISPDDTEFALDGSSLNDAKLKRIRNYIQQHRFCSTNSKKLNSSSTSHISRMKSSVSNKILSRKASTGTTGRQKKQKYMNADLRQRRKLELHGKKEAQSGLFVYEKVIKLSNPLEEDEDVNILE